LQRPSTQQKKKESYQKINYTEEPSDSDSDDSMEIPDPDVYQRLQEKDKQKKNVFTVSYSKKFDQLAKRYGKYLMHQSDRDLPRTHFHSSYTSTKTKQAEEYPGILLVILIVFLTDEGLNLDKENMLGWDRTSAYIHLLELMLMLEMFCKQLVHKRKNLNKLSRYLKEMMHVMKDVINRNIGMEMRYIKFHLILHFVDDIKRFGSMVNFSSDQCESNHKSQVKEPAKNTQRQKDNFEDQTATQYQNNLCIDQAFQEIDKLNGKNMLNTNSKDAEQSRSRTLKYFHEDKAIMILDTDKKNITVKNGRTAICMTS
jgi:hypothetical protein